MKTNSDENTGRDFELLVAAIYERHGYTIDHNIELSGQQIDLLAERVLPGIGLTRVIVECKYRSSGSVSNSEVFDFVSVTKGLMDPHRISLGVMVTNRSFSAPAKAAAKDHGCIRLVTFDELEEELLDVREILASSNQAYERTEIFHDYISLNGVDEARDIPDIESELLKYFESTESSAIVILGDFGAGKTTLMQRLRYRLSQDYLSGKTSQIPLFVPLRDFQRLPSLEALLRSSIYRELYQDIPVSTFWNLAERHRFIFLLDGFDEMVPTADKHARLDNMISLSRVLTSKSRCILTCRPAYFVSDQELLQGLEALAIKAAPLPSTFRKLAVGRVKRGRARAAEAAKQIDAAGTLSAHLLASLFGEAQIDLTEERKCHVLQLKPLDPRQIDLFLQNREPAFLAGCGASWREVKEFLASVYDLSELMTRPILLRLITETIAKGFIDVRNKKLKVGPAGLYEAYTGMQFEWDSRKRFLSKQARSLLAEAVALAMFTAGTLEVTYDEILEIVTQHVGALGALGERLAGIRPEEVASDIHACTFLARHDDGRFRFAHKSFMEFFVARHLKSVVSVDGSSQAFCQPLPKDIVYFLASFANMQPDVWNMLHAWYEAKGAPREYVSNVRNNVASIMLAAGGTVGRFTIGTSTIQDIVLKRSTVYAAVFRGSAFRRVSFNDVAMDDVKFETVTFDQSVLEGLKFSGCVVDGLLKNTTLKRSTFDKTSEVRLAGDGAHFDDCVVRGRSTVSVFKGVEIRALTIIQGTVQAINAKITDCRVENGKASLQECRVERLQTGLQCVIAGAKSEIQESTFRDAEITLSSACTLTGCHVEGGSIRLRESRLVRDEFANQAAVIVTSEGISTLVDCHFDPGTTLQVERTTGERTLTARGCKFLGTTLNVLADAFFENCRFLSRTSLRLEGASMRSCVVEKSELRLSAAAKVIECTMSEAHLTLFGASGERIKDCTLRSCIVVADVRAEQKPERSSGRFVDCTIFGLAAERSEFEGDVFNGCSGMLIDPTKREPPQKLLQRNSLFLIPHNDVDRAFKGESSEALTELERLAPTLHGQLLAIVREYPPHPKIERT